MERTGPSRTGKDDFTKSLLPRPVWMIVQLAFCYGGFIRLQYTSKNTWIYSDISESEASNGSSIARTMQPTLISFGVAIAGRRKGV